MEADQKVALTLQDGEIATEEWDSEAERAPRIGTNRAGLLRRELGRRAESYARTHSLPHSLSFGQTPTVCFERYEDGLRHGNFLPATFTAILKNPNWRRRLQKVHTQGRRSLPRNEFDKWRELDACTSSDALLMNVFCHPRALRDGRVYTMLDAKPETTPEFGVRARVPPGTWNLRSHRSGPASG